MTNDHFPPSRRYPAACPACGALSGYPTVVQTVKDRPGFIRIDISCHACQAEWFQEVDSGRL